MSDANGSPLDPTGGVGGADQTGDISTVGGKDGTPAAPGWTAHLPSDLKTPEMLSRFERFEHLGDLGRALLDAEGKLERAVVIPGEGATGDEVKAFRAKLGIPGTSEAYALKGLKGLPDLPADQKEGVADWFAEVAIGANLSKGQAQHVFRALSQRSSDELGEVNSARVEQRKTAIAKLQSQHGDQYDAVVARGRKIVESLGGEEFSGFLDEKQPDGSVLSNDYRMIGFLAKVQELIGDDKLPRPGAGGAETTSDNPLDPSGWSFDSLGEGAQQ